MGANTEWTMMTAPVLVLAEMEACAAELQALRTGIDSVMDEPEPSILEKGDDYFGLG